MAFFGALQSSSSQVAALSDGRVGQNAWPPGGKERNNETGYLAGTVFGTPRNEEFLMQVLHYAKLAFRQVGKGMVVWGAEQFFELITWRGSL